MALATITFHVTQEDIDKGVVKDCRTCPVVRSVERTLDPYNLAVSHWTATYNWIIGWLSGYDYPSRMVESIVTPGEVMDWMEAFDNHFSVEPFSFELEVEIYGREVIK